MASPKQAVLWSLYSPEQEKRDMDLVYVVEREHGVVRFVSAQYTFQFGPASGFEYRMRPNSSE